MGSDRTLSIRRAGDCARESVGEEEAGVDSVAFGSVVTGSGKELVCGVGLENNGNRYAGMQSGISSRWQEGQLWEE